VLLSGVGQTDHDVKIGADSRIAGATQFKHLLDKLFIAFDIFPVSY
jgi:hypothetical protein